jgi:DNA repair exonuclease SbcCD ATPase subunit
MADEKDRFGEKLRQKEKADEDRFFAEREKAALEKMRHAKAKAQGLECPSCSEPLRRVEHDGVKAEECGTCRGVWLDAHELERLAARARNTWLGTFFFRPRR